MNASIHIHNPYIEYVYTTYAIQCKIYAYVRAFKMSCCQNIYIGTKGYLLTVFV